VAKRFHDEGSFVFICGRRESRLRKSREYISPTGEGVAAIQADLTRGDDLAKVAESILARRGGLDALINCAGIMRFGSLETLEPKALREMLDINAVAPWQLSVAMLPLMRARGAASIVNIASISGMRPFEGSGAYCMSKSALIMMSQVMALELAAERIRVNVLCPGLVEDTELGDAIFSPEQVAASYDRFRSTHPLGRNGKPIDVAEAALFFASTRSSWITGAVLPVDGGRHLASNKPA
jgi:NAD(P)-dependent dehydrogenase (short-subunit alcohol dehydrogenase family)